MNTHPSKVVFIIVIWPFILVQLIKESILVALMDMTRTSAPIPRPLQTKQKDFQMKQSTFNDMFMIMY